MCSSARAGSRRAACACPPCARSTPRPCRPRRARARGPGRSRSGWGDRTRPTARSGPWRGCAGRARSSAGHPNAPRRCASPRADPAPGGGARSSRTILGVTGPIDLMHLGRDRVIGAYEPRPGVIVEPLAGGETVEGLRVVYVPGHAMHHVAYLDPDGSAYVGDVAGVRIPPSEFTLMPTPPPDIDLEAWWRSIDLIEERGPRRLCLTHFGPVEDVPGQLDAARRRLREASERARPGDLGAFVRGLDAQLDVEADPETARRLRQAAPPEQLFAGLDRYWRKRN